MTKRDLITNSHITGAAFFRDGDVGRLDIMMKVKDEAAWDILRQKMASGARLGVSMESRGVAVELTRLQLTRLQRMRLWAGSYIVRFGKWVIG